MGSVAWKARKYESTMQNSKRWGQTRMSISEIERYVCKLLKKLLPKKRGIKCQIFLRFETIS